VRVFTNILLIIILVILTPVLLLLTSVKTNVLQTTFLKNELEKNDIYEIVFTVVDDQINDIDLPEELPLTHEEISSLVHKTLTPQWLQTNVESVLDDFDTWLNAPQGQDISIVLNMAEPKTKLLDEIDILLDEKLKELNPCESDPVDGEFKLCQFAGYTLDDLKAELAKNDFNPDDLVNKIPDEFDLTDPEFYSSFTEGSGDGEENTEEVKEEINSEKIADDEKIDVNKDQESKEDGEDIQAQIAEIKDNLEQVKIYYNFGIGFFDDAWTAYGILAVLFLAMNATRGWKRLVLWTGVLFLTIGIMPLMLGVGSGIGQSIAEDSINIDSDISTQVTDLIPKLLTDLRQAIFTLPLVVGIVLVVLGLAGIIGAHWIPKPKEKVKLI